MIKEVQLFLEKHAYLYENLDSNDCSKAFWSQFMITLLAEAYIPSVKGHLDVPLLNMSALLNSGVSGILGLCGAAVSPSQPPLQQT